MRVLAVDPGREKCGIAVVEHAGVILHREVAPTASLSERAADLMRRFRPDAVVVGDRTAARDATRVLGAIPEVRAAGGVIAVDEAFTTIEARRRYFQAHPPRGLWRLVPLGLRTLPVAVDDWAAVVLAERFLSALPRQG